MPHVKKKSSWCEEFVMFVSATVAGGGYSAAGVVDRSKSNLGYK